MIKKIINKLSSFFLDKEKKIEYNINVERSDKMLIEIKPMDKEMEEVLIEAQGQKQENGNYVLDVIDERAALFIAKILCIPNYADTLQYHQEERKIYYYDNDYKCFITIIE